MKIISVMNIKGGVGKSLTAELHLAHICRKSGCAALLIGTVCSCL